MSGNPGTYIERISENILETRFENFDQENLQNVKKRIIDVVGCLICGVNAPGNLPIIDLVHLLDCEADIKSVSFDKFYIIVSDRLILSIKK